VRRLGRRVAGSVLLSSALASSCSSGPPKPLEPPTFVATSATAPLPALAAVTGISTGLAGIPPDRHALGATRLVSLDVSLHSIPGSNRIVAVSDFAEQPAMYAQIVGEEGLVGPVVTVAEAHFVAAFELVPEAFTIVSSERGRLCARVLEKAKLSTPTCFDADADAIVTLGGRLLLLGARTPLPEEEEAPAGKVKPAHARQTKAKVAPPPPKKKSKPKPISQAEAKKKLFDSGKQVELLGTFVGADGTLEETFGTGLKYREGMAGMSLIGAAARNERVDVLFYEHADMKGKEPRAKLGIAQLDKEGKLDEPTKKSWGESRLEAGFVADHADMRLLTLREGSLALGNRGPRGKCDVTVTAPFVMQMIPVERDCAIDPRRFMALANARRKGVPVDAEEPSSIDAAKAYRAFGQAGWDVGRSVYSNTRAWAMEESRLVYWGGTVKPIEVARPLQVEQNRIHWGTFARDGSGTAETDEGLVFVAAPGTVGKRAGVELGRLVGPDRGDIANAGRRAAARVGGATFQARGELRKIAPEIAPKAMRPLAADTAVLVGGDEKGLLLELSAPAMAISSLSAEGKLTPLTRSKAVVGPGFDAVERAAGGAIVVGPAPGAGPGFVSFVVYANGVVGAPRPIALDATPFVRMAPMPAGGAIVYDSDRTMAVWLDDDGKEQGRAALPAETERAACLDGRPAPAKVPSLVPGQLVDFVSQKTPGTCIVGEIGYRPDGTILWFGSTSSGPHVRADIGVIAAQVKVSAPIGAGAPMATGAMPDVPGGRCPSDMVFVPPDLCVDRYESTLVHSASGRFLSSDYPATPNLIASVLGDFATKRERMGDIFARSMPLPHLSSWQRGGSLSPAAHNQAGVRPNGYVTGLLAKSACEAAGKRLCKLDEWKKACRGEADTIFPYGTTYAKPACNVNGLSHPGAILHDNASILHLDPRLNRVTEKGAAPSASLLQPTGRSAQCKSRWGDDAIYDMVGNVDEWVDEKSGAFAGGFYGRNTTNGCESVISVHPVGYSDYSTGIRCCRAAD
jgi:hypothetical protein